VRESTNSKVLTRKDEKRRFKNSHRIFIFKLNPRKWLGTLGLLFFFIQSKSQSSQDKAWSLDLMGGTSFYYSQLPLGNHSAWSLNASRPDFLALKDLVFRSQLSYANIGSTFTSPLGQALQKYQAQALELSFLTEYTFYPFSSNGLQAYLVGGLGYAFYFNPQSYDVNIQGIPKTTSFTIPLGLGFKFPILNELKLQLEYLHRLNFPASLNGLHKDAWGQAQIGISIPLPVRQIQQLKCWKGL